MELPKSLNTEETYVLVVKEHYYSLPQPFPAEIGQADKQKYMFKANLYYDTPYLSEKQKTSVK